MLRAASEATAGGMNAVASVSSEAGSALWRSLALRSSSWVRCSRRRRVGLVGRDRDDHHRDPVAPGAALVALADRHRDHRHQRVLGQRVALEQPVAHGARAERDDDVVDRRAELAPDLAHRVERERAEREAPVGGDRAVERRHRRRAPWSPRARRRSRRSRTSAARASRRARASARPAARSRPGRSVKPATVVGSERSARSGWRGRPRRPRTSISRSRGIGGRRAVVGAAAGRSRGRSARGPAARP